MRSVPRLSRIHNSRTSHLGLIARIPAQSWNAFKCWYRQQPDRWCCGLHTCHMLPGCRLHRCNSRSQPATHVLAKILAQERLRRAGGVDVLVGLLGARRGAAAARRALLAMRVLSDRKADRAAILARALPAQPHMLPPSMHAPGTVCRRGRMCGSRGACRALSIRKSHLHAALSAAG